MGDIMDFKQKYDLTIAILPSFCIDIETANADQDTINQEVELFKPPANWKPETVEKKRIKHAEHVAAKSALLDTAPVASIAICDEHGDAVVFHWLLMESGVSSHGYTSQQFESERYMLVAFREWINACTDEQTVIVGFNLGFDFPHLRIAYIRKGLKLPNFLFPGATNVIADVMKIYTRHFTSKEALFIGLSEVVKRLGIAPNGKQLDGADVPVYIAKGFEENSVELHEDVITYNAIDVLLTMRAFLICTGQSGD